MQDQKILCATDGSSFSDKAVAHAVAWASLLGQSLTFITVVGGSESRFLVWDETRIGSGDLPVDKPLVVALERAMSNGLKRVGCVRAMSGSISDAVVTYAEKNSYHHIIAGSAGRTGTQRLLIGSVAADIVTRAHCPVTIVR
jgi:nucleotide-binding universal stress UspA family protein